MLIAVVILSPSSEKILSACSLIYLSVLIFKFVVAIYGTSLLFYHTQILVYIQHVVITIHTILVN